MVKVAYVVGHAEDGDVRAVDVVAVELVAFCGVRRHEFGVHEVWLDGGAEEASVE